MNQNTDQSETQETVQTPALGLNDLSSMLTIIEVCSSRGAFRAEELATVGALFNKVQAFVKSHEPRTTNTEASSQEKDSA